MCAIWKVLIMLGRMRNCLCVPKSQCKKKALLLVNKAFFKLILSLLNNAN
jgi:hypothetical protein